MIPESEYANIAVRLLAGETYRSIGESYNVSKESVRLIANKLGLARIGVKIRQKNKARSYGFKTFDLFCECNLKYKDKKSRAKRKNKDFSISFEEFAEKYCNKK